MPVQTRGQRTDDHLHAAIDVVHHRHDLARVVGVDNTYNAPTSVTGTGSTLSFTDQCGKPTATDDGVAQPLKVTLTVTDSSGATAVATSGSGSQPALFVRLYNCGF
jgi:hypothetical protein